MLTLAQFQAFAPHAVKPDLVAMVIDHEAPNYGIRTPLRLAHFLGQCSHESAGFVRLVENLSYSAQRLCQVWPKRFSSVPFAANYAYNPSVLANLVYKDRLGNTQQGDGWKYRGRGFIQLTGRDNYAAAQERLHFPLIDKPELAADPSIAVKTALDFWQHNGLNELADTDDIPAITKRISGGSQGLDERAHLTLSAKTILGLNP